MAARPKSEPLSKVDAAWLHMNRRTNMMMITGVMMFDQPIDFARLKATYECRMAGLFPRFRQLVREGGLFGGPRWEFDPHFKIESHLHRIALPPPGDQAALQDLVGDLMSTPLVRSKPLWDVHLVDGFGQGCAVVTRLSHAIGDGIALMQVLLSLTDSEADAPWPEPPSEYEYKPPLLTRIIVPTMTAVDGTLRLGENMVHEGMETLIHPQRLLGAAKAGVDYTLALGKLLLLLPDRNTMFKGNLGVTKRAAWTQPIPLSEVKVVGKLLCGTVNDVLLGCVAGGLRRYMAARGEATTGLNMRAMVPVNLRRSEEQGQLGNRFGLIYLSLPVGIEDPVERLRTLKRRMDAIKNSPEAVVAFDILNTIGRTPMDMEKVICNLFTLKASAVMTNVPGPREQIYLAGSPLRHFVFWVPTSGDLSLGVSIFSYNGQVIVGISTDAGLAPDPENIVAEMEAEFANMQEYARCIREDTCEEDNGVPMEAAPDAIDLTPVPDMPCGEAPVTQEHLVESVAMQVGKAAERTAQVATAPAPPTNGHNPPRCQAMTRSGNRCRNVALPGQATCRVHSVKA